MEMPSQESGKQCNICIGDLINLFIGSFPEGNRQSQIDQIAQDLRSEYDKSTPTSEDTRNTRIPLTGSTTTRLLAMSEP